MTTKAEEFRAKRERSGPAKAKSPERPRRDDPVDTSKPGVSATDRKAGDGSGTGSRNLSERAAKKGGAALESSATGRPSRKSTRKSADGTKRTSNLRKRATRKASAPKSRATKPRAVKSRAKKG